MLKIKITSHNNIKPIKIILSGWRDEKLTSLYKVIPDCNNLTLWINNKKYGTLTAMSLIEFLHQNWMCEVCSTKEFKEGLKDCIENGF